MAETKDIGAVGAVFVLLALVLVVVLVNKASHTKGVTVPGQSGYHACAPNAFDPAHLGPSCAK